MGWRNWQGLAKKTEKGPEIIPYLRDGILAPRVLYYYAKKVDYLCWSFPFRINLVTSLFIYHPRLFSSLFSSLSHHLSNVTHHSTIPIFPTNIFFSSFLCLIYHIAQHDLICFHLKGVKPLLESEYRWWWGIWRTSQCVTFGYQSGRLNTVLVDEKVGSSPVYRLT